MYNLGLKIWSTNKQYILDAVKLYEKGLFSYIELFAVPNSFDNCINLWKSLNIPFIIHAAHTLAGLNFAKKEQCKTNIILAHEALRYADHLDSNIVIFHPGVDGNITETIRQLSRLNDPRITIENKPYHTINDNRICNGHSPEQIKKIIQETNVHFCFDVAHALYAANALKQKHDKFLQKFLDLKPIMYHLADGDIQGVIDQHEHIGYGSFDITNLLKKIPLDSSISIETKKDSPENLDDFEQDIKALKKLTKKNVDYFTLNPAQQTDVKDIFELANDTIVRKNSLNQEAIAWENHVSWFSKKIESNETIFYVIKTTSNNFVGYVRFDEEINNQGHTISVALNKKYRGYGLGSQLINQATQKVFSSSHVKKVIALIKQTNKNSIKCFETLGYKLIEQNDKKGQTILKYELHKS